MAKTKKQEKPIEQRLEEALVLYEKTPYELPSNWCWTTFEQIANLYTGNSINEREKELKYTGLSEGYNYIATKDIGFDYEIEYENGIKIPYEETRFKKARKGASLLCIEGGSAGRKLGFLQEEVCFVNKLCCFDFHGLVDKLYFYYLQSNEFFNLFNANKVGLIGGVSVNNLKQIAVPLAPLEEQKRIVEIIEKQFAKLDEARDLIQKSLDSFADRKSAILHRAFTGELTKQWRENNSVIQRKNTVNFLDCIEDMQNGISKRNGKEGKDFIVLRLADLKENRISTDDNRTIKLTETEIKKYQLKENDIIMIRVNGSKEYVGRQILFNMECACAYCDHIIRIQYRKDISPKFMLYFSQTREYKDYILQNLVSSAGQNTISRKGLSRLKLNLPLFEEQEEIVRILDSIFEKEDKSKELIDMLDKIDEMKKSILARAFRGELGTSNPTDEPAIDLLKKILEQNN